MSEARVLIALVLALASLTLAACGDDDDDRGDSAEVTLNAAVEPDVDDADPDATDTPAGAAVLDEFEELRTGADAPEVPAIRGSAGLSTADWIHAVNGDVATYWQQQFNNGGYRYKPAKELIFDRKLSSACGIRASLRTGPFYCTADQAIYYPVTFFDRVPQRFGDAATAVVVAHENAHRVQDIIGLFDAPRIISAQLELQADCLAGVWAKTIYERGLLEKGDIGEILGLVEIAGDPRGTPINAPGAHGSSALRQQYFDRGYNGGDPGSCPVPKKKQLPRSFVSAG